MYRGRTKRLPEPTSEFSLNNIKSDDGNSINKESDNCHKRVKPFHNSQSETLDETSRLISENSGYDFVFQSYIQIKLFKSLLACID